MVDRLIYKDDGEFEKNQEFDDLEHRDSEVPTLKLIKGDPLLYLYLLVSIFLTAFFMMGIFGLIYSGNTFYAAMMLGPFISGILVTLGILILYKKTALSNMSDDTDSIFGTDHKLKISQDDEIPKIKDDFARIIKSRHS